jgi:uncharacterized SAM-binding protein YcdF (DUF218 family)
MLTACLLLMIAIIGGTLLTFLFDRSAPRAARLCMGAAVGLALLASVGFLTALAFGLGPASITLSATILLLPLLLLFDSNRRAVILNSLRPANGFADVRIGYLVFYLAMAILLGMVFGRAAFEHADGIYTGVTNNLGDLPLHFQVVNSFVQGSNLPPQDPTYAGVRFAYPFMVDFLTAMLVRAGAGMIAAMWLQNMVLAISLVGLLHYWTLLLTRNRLAGLIAPLLVFFSGGLGWWLLFSDVAGGDGFFSTVGNLQHDYTIVPNSILRWGNSLTTLFVPQRSILFGLPLAITIFCQWWLAISQQENAATPATPADPANTASQDKVQERVSARRAKKPSRAQRKAAALEAEPQNFYLRRMLAAGVCAGLLPLIHAHTFLVAMGMAVCLTLLFCKTWRGWVLFFVAAMVLAAPEILWLANTGGVNARSYLGWQPGWDHGTHNIAWFWFVNTGLFIPLLIVALAWRRGSLALPPRLLRFYFPFLLCFIVPNLMKVAPWVWDNIKVLFLWYVASAPLVAWLLARWWQRRSVVRWLAPPILATLILAGSLDVLRVISEASEYQEFDSQAIAAASLISGQAAPRALVLNAPTYNSPVFLTGRGSVLGYPGWMWSRGLDYSQRHADIERIYSGAPGADALLKSYGVDYVLIGPAEFAAFPVSEQFWSQYGNPARTGAYRIYQTRVHSTK